MTAAKLEWHRDAPGVYSTPNGWLAERSPGDGWGGRFWSLSGPNNYSIFCETLREAKETAAWNNQNQRPQ